MILRIILFLWTLNGRRNSWKHMAKLPTVSFESGWNGFRRFIDECQRHSFFMCQSLIILQIHTDEYVVSKYNTLKDFLKQYSIEYEDIKVCEPKDPMTKQFFLDGIVYEYDMMAFQILFNNHPSKIYNVP